jgi:hypothetical protein
MDGSDTILEVIGIADIDLGTVGFHTITYTCKNRRGVSAVAPQVRTVTVVDSYCPRCWYGDESEHGSGDTTIEVEASFKFNDPGACFVDEALGALATRVQVTNPVNTLEVGTYSIKYQALDTYRGIDPATLTFAQYDQQQRFANFSCAGHDVCARKVVVEDTLKPVIALEYAALKCGEFGSNAECSKHSWSCKWSADKCVALSRNPMTMGAHAADPHGAIQYPNNSMHPIPTTTENGPGDTALHQHVWVTNPMKEIHTTGAYAAGTGRYFKTYDTEHELGTAPWLAIPEFDSMIFDTARKCKDACAAMPACMYGTYVSGGGERKGECWLSANAAEGAPHKCGVPCESFFDNQVRASLPVMPTKVTTVGVVHRRLLAAATDAITTSTRSHLVGVMAIAAAVIATVLVVLRSKPSSVDQHEADQASL